MHQGEGITRFKQHLTRQKGDIAPCPKVYPNEKCQIDKMLNDGKMEKAKQKQTDEEIGNPHGTPIEVEGKGRKKMII